MYLYLNFDHKYYAFRYKSNWGHKGNYILIKRSGGVEFISDNLPLSAQVMLFNKDCDSVEEKLEIAIKNVILSNNLNIDRYALIVDRSKFGDHHNVRIHLIDMEKSMNFLDLSRHSSFSFPTVSLAVQLAKSYTE